MDQYGRDYEISEVQVRIPQIHVIVEPSYIPPDGDGDVGFAGVNCEMVINFHALPKITKLSSAAYIL